jgi:hypothetical protein
LSKQSAIEWMDSGQKAMGTDHSVIAKHRAPNGADAAVTDLEVLFALQLERLTPGSSHVGGRFGAIVQCPRCQRSACFIGGRRYAHGVRLLRQWSSTRDANGACVQVLDVQPEWQSICVGSSDRTVAENVELFAD